MTMTDTKSILLVGDFSGVHSELRKELKERGYNVFLVSDGDVYKKFNADLLIRNEPVKGLVSRVLRRVSSFVGLDGFCTFAKNYNNWKELRDFDVVQLINPSPLQGFGFFSNYIFLHFLIKNNNKIFLSALGEDYYWVKHCIDKKYKYSALDNLNNTTRVKYKYTLRHLKLWFKVLNDLAVKHAIAIIPGLYDYKIAYQSIEKCTDVIPLPVDKARVSCVPIETPLNNKIVIFHGWQKGKELKKGNLLFDAVVKKILLKYPNDVEYRVLSNVPYSEYIRSFEDCHIFLDQCYSYDRGVNAVLGMAAGKVVFSGAEQDSLNCYDTSGLDDVPLINALPNEDSLFYEIENLILNRKRLHAISISALAFINKNHLNTVVVDRYLDVWSRNENKN